MKVKVFFLILSIFSFIPLSTLAQDYIPDPDIQIEEFKEIDRQRAEEAQKKASESEDSSPQASKKGGKIKALYNDFIEKSDEVNEKQKISGSQLVADFITDKLPLTLDFGAEPGEHGSAVFGILQYDWNEKRASRLGVEYSSAKTSQDSTNQYSSDELSKTAKVYDWMSFSKNRQIEIDFYPYIRYFGDDSNEAYSPFIYFGLGAFYSYSWYTRNYSGWIETDTAKVMLKSDIDGHNHQFGPIAIASIKFPFLSIFGLHFQVAVSPINRIVSSADTSASTHSLYLKGSDWVSENASTSSLVESSQWCSPLMLLDLSVDAFKYFRFRTRFYYNRIYVDLGSLSDINASTLTLDDDENKQETYIWRFGGEIVFPSSNRTRKKDSHLWAGFYYEHTWDVTTTGGNSATSHSGKWILCFGT
ncbi:MAG: hypothetical protein IJT42_03390 [Treponema sp.]|nr:hypothetical protein [Treponema sp.]